MKLKLLSKLRFRLKTFDSVFGKVLIIWFRWVDGYTYEQSVVLSYHPAIHEYIEGFVLAIRRIIGLIRKFNGRYIQATTDDLS